MFRLALARRPRAPSFKLPAAVLVFGLATVMLGTVLATSGHASADTLNCGITSGDPHDYAGVVVDMTWQYSDNSGGGPANNTQVQVTTASSAQSSDATGTGNIVHLAGNHTTILHREHSETFNQYSSGCYDGYNVVLGYNSANVDNQTSDYAASGQGNTTDGTVWALDCDISVHPSYYEQFSFTGVGVPAGIPAGATNGHWTPIVTDPTGGGADANGTTLHLTLVYTVTKPHQNNPPPPPSSNTMSITCSNVSGFVWLASGSYKSGDAEKGSNNALNGHYYKIIQDTGGGNGPVVATGTISSSNSPGPNYSVGINGAAIYGDGSSPQTLFIEVYNTASPMAVQLIGPAPAVVPAGFTQPADGGTGNTGYYNCADDQPTGTVSATCGGINIGDLSDNNAPGAAVSYSLTISSGNVSEVIPGDASGSDYQYFDIYNIGGQPPGANGFHVVLTVNDIAAPDSGSAAAGSFSTSADSGPCWSASCSLSVDANAPTGASGQTGDVLAGQTFTVTATINGGDSYLPSNIGGNPLGFTNSNNNDFPLYNATSTMPDIDTVLASASNGYASDEPFGSDVGIGDSPTKTLTFTAPAFTNGKTFSMSVYPDFYGRFGIGSPCTASVNVYQHFTLTGGASSTSVPTDEDPSTVDYSTWVTSTAPVPVDASTTSSVYKKPYPSGTVYMAGTPTADGGPFAANGQTYALSPSSVPVIAPLVAGDKYYAEIDLGYTDAYVGPGGPTDILDPTGGTDTPADFEVHNEPYVHFVGSSVSAGGGFAGASSCSTAGGIYTYTNTPGIKTSGSGVQIGALAIGPIQGFNSANLRSSAPTSPAGLTFSNTTNTSGYGVSSAAPNEGGDLGGSNCIPDYFGTRPSFTTNATTAVPVTITTTDPGDGTVSRTAQYYANPPGGTLTINPSTIDDSTDLAIYVKGNVYITGDANGNGITYKNTSWSTIESVPSVYIVAEGGTIYIDPGVKQLDGVYVSEPDSSNTGGYINTCATPSVQYSGAQLLTSCSNQLLVNGAFVARQVELNRSFGSLRESSAGETYSPTTKSCGDSGTTTFGDCAAEIFNFSPEVYLSQPATQENSGPTTGTYDYITSLSPVL